MIYCPECEPEKAGIGWIALACVRCQAPAYLIAMGDNDALLERDLIERNGDGE